MNQGYYPCAQSPTMKGGPLPPSPHLKSCLRQGTFSRGNITISGGGGASTKTHSSAPTQAMLQYQYDQSRQEEGYSTRSAASDPTMWSTYSPSSAPTVGGATRRNSGPATNDISDCIVEDSERLFTRISRLLVSQHMSASHHNDSSYATQLLHHHLPSVQQRMSFYINLQRNTAHLPMFPEPNEHHSLAITRYIEKIFGPILAREVKNGTGNTSDIGQSSMSYAMQRYPQHYFIQSPQLDPSLVSYKQQSPYHRSTTYSFDTSRREQPMRYNIGEPMFPPPPTEECADIISPTYQVSTNHEIQPSISIHPSSDHHPVQRRNGNSTQLSITIPSPTSLPGSMLPTPMASNTSTKTKPIFQQPHSVTFASEKKSSSNTDTLRSGKLLEPQRYQMGPQSNSPMPQPSFAFPFNNNMQNNDPSQKIVSSGGCNASSNIQKSSQSLVGSCTDSISATGNERDNRQVFVDEKKGHIKSVNRGSIDTISESSSSSTSSVKYQPLTSKDMLPPMKPRETILYFPRTTKSACCDGVLNTSRLHSIQKRPPSYLQLYVKCERSEPFINKDLDIVTWYRNASDSRVTAERTLVVRGTTNMMELICGIVESFGLKSPHNDDVCENANNKGNEYSLDCYKGVCFVSDIKTTKCKETAKINLTPLPIPGLHYKYVDRSDDGNCKRNEKGIHKSSSVLSMDPYGLRRTLVAQLLDKSSLSPKSNNKEEEGTRDRLALVYCAPKRRAHVSLRSTHQGVLPETIYHFQLILEGIVNEDDLPSSFQSQTAIRCVGATGGVLGGSVIDTKEEIDELNRILWKGRDVVGLSTPKANQRENLEQIIDVLGVPLFDLAGNQTPKEFVVDRCLYNIYSGKLSMEVAQKTQDTVEAIEGTAEWLARRVDTLAKTLAACEDSYLAFENDKFDEFDAVVSRLEKKWIFA